MYMRLHSYLHVVMHMRTQCVTGKKALRRFLERGHGAVGARTDLAPIRRISASAAEAVIVITIIIIIIITSIVVIIILIVIIVIIVILVITIMIIVIASRNSSLQLHQ